MFKKQCLSFVRFFFFFYSRMSNNLNESFAISISFLNTALSIRDPGLPVFSSHIFLFTLKINRLFFFFVCVCVCCCCCCFVVCCLFALSEKWWLFLIYKSSYDLHFFSIFLLTLYDTFNSPTVCVSYPSNKSECICLRLCVLAKKDAYKIK